jgi:hypothetical protein
MTPIFCPLEPVLRECWVNAYTNSERQFTSGYQHKTQEQAVDNRWRSAYARIHVIPKPGFEGVRLA